MGDIFGGLGGLLGQGQAHQQPQGLPVGSLVYSKYPTFTIDTPYGMGMGETYGGGGQPEIKKPETAVAWLDRRVEEMRVRL